MSEIKRYDLDEDRDSDGCLNILGMSESDVGEYVKFSAHPAERRATESAQRMCAAPTSPRDHSPYPIRTAPLAEPEEEKRQP